MKERYRERNALVHVPTCTTSPEQGRLAFADGPNIPRLPRRRTSKRRVGVLPAGTAAEMAGIKEREKQRQVAEGQAHA
ncbi:MAG TPA: hypothetical protein VN699_16195 [Pirellulales bacterium]|nr:hypothetical protein [Pirellulales bacterium]